MARLVHIIGAGLAGLATAVRLSAQGVRATVYEATNQAGGRCRSYHDPALGITIDNGNHLLLSGNRAALGYLDTIGARDRLAGPSSATFPFIDLASHERWTLRANNGRLPWWILDAKRRVPGTRARDYLSILRLLRAAPGATIGEVLDCKGPLYDRLLGPLLLAALNTEPPVSSATLAAAVLRETLAAGGRSYRPLFAREGLSAAFVEPALKFIEANGGAVLFGQRLRACTFEAKRVAGLDFGDVAVPLHPGDAAVLAVPPVVAAALVSDLTVPNEFRAIVNAHFRLTPPPGLAPMTGIINGTAEWLFAFPDRLSVTISSGDRLLDTPREELAALIWREVAEVAGIAGPQPPWQIVRERRATFAALPREDAKRPDARTRWNNLLLAGDWTATGLPATIEGAIRSGNRAAELIGKMQ
ncbi:MAG TPA: hydroxysqualene dehydroxylase HpnE [Pseudolabrys sp.]|jgi:squalene-associated FAD-dependent desaturase